MKKFTKSTILGLTGVLLSVAVVLAATTFAGIAGDDSVDPDAEGLTYYLRHVGNPAPEGYSHLYQWADPVVVCDPNNTPTVFTGTVDVSNMNVGDVAMVGLLDQTLLASGDSAWGSGAYVYVHKRNSTEMRIGPTDGSDGGEIVQAFGIYPIPLDDGIMNIDMTIHDTTISVSVNDDTPIVDDYGQLEDANTADAYDGNEFDGMAVLGWDVFPDSINMPYDFEVQGCEVIVNDPTTKDDCKNGGWEAYGFSNQGRCIQFVNTGIDSR